MSAPRQPPTPDQSRSLSQRLGGLLNRGRAAIAAAAATLAALVLIVTNWNTLTSDLFPSTPASEAAIHAEVEQDISLQEYDLQDRSPSQGRASGAAATFGGSSRAGFGSRFAVYTVPLSVQPDARRLFGVAAEEATKTTGQAIKQEGEQVTEEAKRTEEGAAREAAKAASEQKLAEEHEQEEQKKELEAQKRAEETEKQGASQAKVEEANARREVQHAQKTVRVKKQEAAHPAVQRRIETGAAPDRVEEVLHDAHLPEGCRPTCGLKSIVEKALKSTSNDPAQAAAEVRSVGSRGSGARVHFEAVLKGLEGKVVILTYSLVQTSGAPPPAQYLASVPIKTVVPTREKEPVRGIGWVPVPSNSRHYYLELTAYDGEAEVGHRDTSVFW